jgi:type IV pilus assembly protein PilP
MKPKAPALLFLLVLAACSGPAEDTREFVKNAGKDLRGKVEPLPEVKPYEPFTYDATDLPDPFKPRKLAAPKGSGGGVQPDFNRPKEALEGYALETLKMVGTLQRDKITYAIIKTPDNSLYRVKAGNYMGQNFGIITQVTENEVKLTEIVQDSAGDWTERNASLTLTEEQQPQKK